MYIGIDGNEANTQNRVGSNIYAHNVLTGLYNLDTKTNYQVYLKSPPQKDLPKSRENFNYKSFGPSTLWTQWRLPLDLYLNKPHPSVFFTPGHYAPRFCPVPSVISIMDLAFLYYPQAFKPLTLAQIKLWTSYSVKHAAHILTISNHSKKDIAKEYHVNPNKITVTHLGSNLTPPKEFNPKVKQKITQKYKIPGKFFIFVGTKQPRKNLETLIKAFNKLHSTERNIHLVIVGKTWHQFAQTSLAVNQNTIFTGYVPDDDLAFLIKSAEALILPSFYEGFGIPVLEAMTLGTLAAASNTSSLPEVTGKSPLLFDPNKQSQLEAVLNKILTMSPDTKKKIIREGKIRAKQFSWQNTTKKTMEVLHEIALQR